jgi:hypothetical protein
MEFSQCDLQEIIALCQSSEGCTHYDVVQDKYLILWNDDDTIVDGRKRWTQAHELGHVVLKHLLIAHKPENQSNLSKSEYETEADYFAAMLLCPTPACEVLHISSPSDIQKKFGLSRTAALNRWKDYQRGGQHHHKTAWHDDLERVILQKIDHLDGNPRNDCLWNLACMTIGRNAEKGTLTAVIFEPFFWFSINTGNGYRILCGTEVVNPLRFFCKTSADYVNLLRNFYCTRFGAECPPCEIDSGVRVGYDDVGNLTNEGERIIEYIRSAPDAVFTPYEDGGKKYAVCRKKVA